MNTISALTREMILEYESIIGRKLTPQEYLQFREQAMIEIQNGFGSKIQNVSTSYVPQVIEPTILEQKPLERNLNITNNEYKEPIPIKSVKELEPKVESLKVTEVSKKTEPKVKTVKEPEDPFFALIDKMDA